VLACRKKEHRKILGLDESYADPVKEREAIENSFSKRATSLHLDYNTAKGTEKGFKSKSCSTIYPFPGFKS
jgi:hypothetical protein